MCAGANRLGLEISHRFRKERRERGQDRIVPFQVIDITESQRTICFPEVELNSARVQKNTRRVYC